MKSASMATVTKESEQEVNKLTLTGQDGSSFLKTVQEKLSYLNTRVFLRRGEVEVLDHPAQFYTSLKEKISAAHERVFMASLYLGKTENELLSCISDSLRKNKDLKVYFLVDGLRGTRETPNKCSASLLAGLEKEFGERVEIRLYRTPEFVGWKTLIPKRFNEGLGLQHMKIYGIDEEVILSGANLSNDYFTNRQDRYYVFKNKFLAEYYFKVHQLISNISYRARYASSPQKYDLEWPKSNLAVEPMKDKHKFIEQCSSLLSKFLRGSSSMGNAHLIKDFSQYPTIVYPVSQFTPLFHPNNDLSTEKPGIISILSCMSNPLSKWTFTAGYFNMLPEIKQRLLDSPSVQGQVITASPYANGFFQSAGVSGHLPDAYLYLSHAFLKDVHRHGKENHIKLREWKHGVVNQPNGWSYHAKGLWLSEPGDDKRPSLTIVGSSNYTRRAYSLDIETNAIVLTQDEELKSDMQREVTNLLKNTKEVTLESFEKEPDRNIGTGVKLATKLLGNRL
ncbi:unnamed protein product [Kluyveromyces dobzhanskii CBS 2104]|uniref:CDP-diacylglycerol--glycerol-3-phosphate 3-phosphatidyltransferase n=1 Tax=Kluyveromyces dobzhanskii CBS 2104 TaxID=1427455 RepID=A0A0A8L0X1_9SACH|nr:unnamed protein product [Kluyveromyces dobzhanskii CBS 2104]